MNSKFQKACGKHFFKNSSIVVKVQYQLIKPLIQKSSKTFKKKDGKT